MKRFFAGSTDPGLLRANNQDAYYLDTEGRFFIVADGMGGHAGGQEASRLATDVISAHLDKHWHIAESSQELLRDAFFKANDAILNDQSSHPERSDMGTTAVVLMFRGEQLWCAHVGDSRLYRLRADKLEQITEDHTWVARAIREGELTPEQSKSHPWRHVLSQCLGREDLTQISLQTVTMQASDRFLLCSDGLTEELTDGMIAGQLQANPACAAAADALVEAAKSKGGRDNITVIVLYLRAEES